MRLKEHKANKIHHFSHLLLVKTLNALLKEIFLKDKS